MFRQEEIVSEVANLRHKKKFETRYDPASYLEQMTIDAAQESCADLAIIRERMEYLSREHREILVLICIQGLRYEEAAEQLQVPVGTIRSRLSRARQELQHILAPTEGGPGHLAYGSAANGDLSANYDFQAKEDYTSNTGDLRVAFHF